MLKSNGVGQVSAVDGIRTVLSDGMLYGTYGSRRLAERVLYSAALEILALRRERELFRRLLSQLVPDIDIESADIEEVTTVAAERFSRLSERVGMTWQV